MVKAASNTIAALLSNPLPSTMASFPAYSDSCLISLEDGALKCDFLLGWAADLFCCLVVLPGANCFAPTCRAEFRFFSFKDLLMMARESITFGRDNCQGVQEIIVMFCLRGIWQKSSQQVPTIDDYHM